MIREGQRWMVAIICAGVGLVFVFFLGLGNPGSGDVQIGSVATVGPIDIDGRAFERARANQERFLEQQMGEQFESRRFSDQIDSLALRDVVDEALMVLIAEDLGITVSNPEVEQVVRTQLGFLDEGGRFDVEAYRNQVEWEFGNEANFIRAQRSKQLMFKVYELLSQQPHVSDAEVRTVLERELSQVKLAYTAIDIEVDEEAPVAREQIEEAISSRAAELETLYEGQRSRFEAPEEVRARHILVALAQGAEGEALAQAEAKAAEIRARLDAGEDFSAVAQETSDDQATRPSGGDLGLFRRGQMVPEFEDAAFGASVGELVGPVRSNFGLHLILVEERNEERKQSLEDVRETLAAELVRQDLALEAARSEAEALAAAVQEGTSLEDASRSRGHTLDRTDWVSRRQDGFVTGLGVAPDLLATAFGLEAGGSSERIFEVGPRLVLVQVLEHLEADADEIEARFDATRDALLQERRDTRANTWVSAKRDALLDEGELVVDLEGYRNR